VSCGRSIRTITSRAGDECARPELCVPPYVRQGLFSRSINNDDLLPKIRKPVLIAHGAADAVVKPAVVAQHKGAMPHAQVQLMANTGHAAFWDDASGFNECLHAFCETL